MFDKKCARCHQEEEKGISFDYWKSPPQRSGGGPVGDIEQYVRYYHASGLHRSPWKGVGFLNNKKHEGRAKAHRYRSHPGTFGALGSPLLKYLDDSHYGVSLTPEEYQRVVLWLDTNCQELGCYDPRPEALAAQRRGEPRWPVVDVDPRNPTGIQLDGEDRD